MKPYDLSVLTAKLKERGLNLVEDEVKVVIHELAGWLSESAKLSETPFDDVALAVIPLLEKAGTDLADKIDGQVG